MGRLQLTEVFWRRADQGGGLVAFAANYPVRVYLRDTETPAVLWSARSGGVEVAQRLRTNDDGQAVDDSGNLVWLDPGEYDVVVAGRRFTWPQVGSGGVAEESAPVTEDFFPTEIAEQTGSWTNPTNILDADEDVAKAVGGEGAEGISFMRLAGFHLGEKIAPGSQIKSVKLVYKARRLGALEGNPITAGDSKTGTTFVPETFDEVEGEAVPTVLTERVMDLTSLHDWDLPSLEDGAPFYLEVRCRNNLGAHTTEFEWQYVCARITYLPPTAGTLVLLHEDPMTEANPESVWGEPIDAPSTSRFTLSTSGGDTRPTIFGGPSNGRCRKITIKDGDRPEGDGPEQERCEMGHNESRYGYQGGFGTFGLLQPGRRYRIGISYKLLLGFPISTTAWQLLGQFKQAQPYVENNLIDFEGDLSPILALQARENSFQIIAQPDRTEPAPLYSVPAAIGPWVRFIYDIVTATELEGGGSIRVRVDDREGAPTDFVAVHDSGVIAHPTLVSAKGDQEQGDPPAVYKDGEAIPGHMRVGIYRHSIIEGEAEIEVSNIQFADMGPAGNSGGGVSGAVESVNGLTGAVTLAAADVGADASGAAAAAQAASQPLDSDLTAIAALTTAGLGRSLLTKSTAAQIREATEAQPLDSDLTAIAALTTKAFGRGLLTKENVSEILEYLEAQKALGFTAENAANKSTDGTFASNSDTLYPSQKAAKTYMDGRIAAANAVVYKGAKDCSANPNYPAAEVGHLYVVSVAGKIGGSSGTEVEAGDLFLCKEAAAEGNQATVGAKWDVIEKNDTGVVAGPASSTDGEPVLFNGTTGKSLKTGMIGTNGLSGEAVTSAKIGSEAVTAAKLAANSVETAKVKTEAITAEKLASGAVTEGKIATGAVTEGKLGSAAVSTGKIANEAVTEEKLSSAVKAKLKGAERNPAGFSMPAGTEVKAEQIGQFWQAVASGQTVKLIGMKYTLASGTKAKFSIKQNGSAVTGFKELEAKSSEVLTVSGKEVSVADGDLFALVVESIEGTPKGISVTLFFESTH